MDRDTLGNVLFLTGLAALSVACAEGSSGPGPRPGPFVTGAGDDDPGDPWTDPFETTGAGMTSGSGETGNDDGGWPNEGETGQVSSDTGEPPGSDDGDPGMDTTDAPPSGDESGDYGSTGYGYEPLPDDPCSAFSQVYADCSSNYSYDELLDLCEQSRVDANSVSVACGLAQAEYLACLSSLDCTTLLQPEVPFACVFQATARDLACGA